MMRIAITGNIGCGKSTVCAILAKLLPGYAQFSVDDAVRALYQQDEYTTALTERFGTAERRVLSDMVFAQPDLKKALEDFAMEYLLPQLEAAMAQSHVIVEFPLLYEIGGWAHRFDFVLALGCDDETQRERVLSRDGMPVEKFEQIKASQLPTARKAAMADAYIDTSVSVEDVERQLKSMLVPPVSPWLGWAKSASMLTTGLVIGYFSVRSIMFGIPTF
jgi:dephospho-CoA kinase